VYRSLCFLSARKLLIERLYPMLNRHEIVGAEGEAINIRWEAAMQQPSEELQRGPSHQGAQSLARTRVFLPARPPLSRVS